MDSAVAALLGALIGAVSSVGVMAVQERFRAKRDWLRMAMELGIKDWELRNENAKVEGGTVWPLDIFVFRQSRILGAIANKELDAKFLERLNKEQAALSPGILGANTTGQSKS